MTTCFKMMSTENKSSSSLITNLLFKLISTEVGIPTTAFFVQYSGAKQERKSAKIIQFSAKL